MPRGHTSQGEAVAIGAGLVLFALGLTVWVTSAVASQSDWRWIAAGIIIASVGTLIVLAGLGFRFLREPREGAPDLILTFAPPLWNQGARWHLTNAGKSTAVNAGSDQFSLNRFGARIERIARLDPGATQEVEFMQSIDGQDRGHAVHPDWVLKNGIRDEADRTLHNDPNIVEKLADWVIPIRLTCTDPSGVVVAKRFALHWDYVNHRGHVQPLPPDRSWGAMTTGAIVVVGSLLIMVGLWRGWFVPSPPAVSTPPPITGPLQPPPSSLPPTPTAAPPLFAPELFYDDREGRPCSPSAEMGVLSGAG